MELDGYGSSSTPSDEENDSCLVSEDTKDHSFTAAGVRFDFDNKIFVKFRTTDIKKIRIKINEVDFSDNVSYVDGEIHQILTYSVNSYAYAKYEQNTPIAELTLALYRYGLSAKAYLG